MKIKVLFLNCDLKKSLQGSNTGTAIHNVAKLFNKFGVGTEIVCVADYHIYFGLSSYKGKKDEWPKILRKIGDCDVLVICSPVWFGIKSSLAQMVIERLNETYYKVDVETEQSPLYGKVGGVIITGNKDLAHNVSANILFILSHLGFTIPPNADSYCVEDVSQYQSYRYMVNNLVYFAKLLKENPIPTI